WENLTSCRAHDPWSCTYLGDFKNACRQAPARRKLTKLFAGQVIVVQHALPRYKVELCEKLELISGRLSRVSSGGRGLLPGCVRVRFRLGLLSCRGLLLNLFFDLVLEFTELGRGGCWRQC